MGGEVTGDKEAMMEWPRKGRAGRSGQPPTDKQARAIFFVYQMNGPVGDGVTLAEIRQELPELTMDELADACRANWIKVDFWGIIGGEVAPDAVPDCYDVLPDGVAFLRAEQAKRIPEHEHEWHESETKERFNPPWESCAVCHAWRKGPNDRTRLPELWYQLHDAWPVGVVE